MDPKEAVLRYLTRGCCCTEALLRFGLELLNEEEDDYLIDAAAGLCDGMFSGGVCGGLTGGCMLLAMVDRESAAELCREYYDWFEMTFSAKYGSVQCSDIRGDDPWNKLERCQPLIILAAEKCAELLRERGLIE